MENIKFIFVVKTCLIALFGVSTLQAGTTRSTIKDWIDHSSEAFKRGVDELGNDFRAIQDYLNSYSWRDIIQENATSGAVTLRHLELNDHCRAVVAKPGEKIDAEVKCYLDPDHSSIFGLYRIVVGLKGEGAQAVIGTESGLFPGKKREKFTLIAPEKPGLYQVRFRCVDALFQSTALNAWVDDKGDEPDATTTIGIIFVK